MTPERRIAFFVASAAAITLGLMSCVGEDTPLAAVTAKDAEATVDAGVSDASANTDGDGTTDAAASTDAGCRGLAACERAIFATQNTRTGNLGGAVGADAFCTAEANSVGADPRVRGREFVAWISFVAGTAAERHVHGIERYVRPDGTQVATNWDALVSGALEADVGQDQYRATATGTAWTGTNADGSRAQSNCVDFSSPLAADIGVGGAMGSITSTWSASASFKCDTGRRVICIEK